MGDDERTTLEEGHQKILDKISRAEGVFWGTGGMCVLLIALIAIIYSGMADSIKQNTKATAVNKQDIAVLKSKGIDYDKWRKTVNTELERVRFKK